MLDLSIFLAGACGALVEEILKDNCIVFPKIISGKLLLGTFGGLLVGGIAGMIIDGSMVTAFMGGFMGKAVIMRLMDGNFGDLKTIFKNTNQTGLNIRISDEKSPAKAPE